MAHIITRGCGRAERAGARSIIDAVRSFFGMRLGWNGCALRVPASRTLPCRDHTRSLA